jgi:aspartyl-tRNA synthetase
MKRAMAKSLQMAITANASSTDSRVTGDSEGDNQGDRRCFDARIHGDIIRGQNSGFDILLRRKGEFIQAKLEPGVADATSLQTASKLTPESLVRVLGSFLKDQSSANSIVPTKEIAIFQIAKIELLSAAAERLPNTLKLHGAPGELTPPAEQRDRLINDRLDNRLLESRVAATAAIFKVFSGVHELAIAYLGTHDFQFIPTPACVAYRFPGEDDDHFMLPFFEGTAMLAPTGEIHLGMALAADLERVYDFHTVFRREPASDGRHLTEVQQSLRYP